MGLLNRPSDGLPSVGIALIRVLAESGPRDVGELVALCDPPGLNRDKESMVTKTVNRWVQLGVFEEDDGRVALNEDFQTDNLFQKADPLLRGLRWRVLRKVLEVSTEPLEESPAGDLMIACWWLLQQDPTKIWLDSELAATTEAGRDFPGKVVIQNDTRWQGLLDWAPFLGLATMLRGALIPDPTEAVSWAVINGDLPVGKSVPAREFLERLEKHLPILGVAGVSKAAAVYFGRTSALNEAKSIAVPPLALALRALQRRGMLDLQGRQDAPDVFLLQEPGRSSQTRIETITVLIG